MLRISLLFAASFALAVPVLVAAEEAQTPPDSAAPAKPAAAPARQPVPLPEIKAVPDGAVVSAGRAGMPLVKETPLMAEARKRSPKDLWNEMGLIQDEMRLFLSEGRHDSLPDLADRWVADMMAAFTQVYEGAILPRQVGMKRAAMTCARVGSDTRRALALDQEFHLDQAVRLVEGCNQLFARFLPPDVTGRPDEFATWKPRGPTDPAAEGSKPQ